MTDTNIKRAKNKLILSAIDVRLAYIALHNKKANTRLDRLEIEHNHKTIKQLQSKLIGNHTEVNAKINRAFELAAIERLEAYVNKYQAKKDKEVKARNKFKMSTLGKMTNNSKYNSHIEVDSTNVTKRSRAKNKWKRDAIDKIAADNSNKANNNHQFSKNSRAGNIKKANNYNKANNKKAYYNKTSNNRAYNKGIHLENTFRTQPRPFGKYRCRSNVLFPSTVSLRFVRSVGRSFITPKKRRKFKQYRMYRR